MADSAIEISHTHMYEQPIRQMKYDKAIIWFRRDLRLSDNTALAQACLASRLVIPVFVFDTTILSRLEDKDDRRVTFIHRSLQELARKLRERGSDLVVLIGDPLDVIPRLASEAGAGAVFVNRDYEPRAKLRDTAVRRALEADGRELWDFKDQVVFEGLEVASRVGTPYVVFTPYKRAWLARFRDEAEKGAGPAREMRVPAGKMASAAEAARLTAAWDFGKIGFVENHTHSEAGERAAKTRLREFMRKVDRYAADRNFPAIDGTSRLSVHLRFGTVSIRELIRSALERECEGAEAWLTELIWREFYQMILDRFPHAASGAFRREYDAVRWPGREEHFEAWRQGRTGYPIVDAAMRHFNATGWMHNRLRMVVASFLVKDLLVDWRWGEACFARGLLDFDIAANNGGWQWSASTGCDAQPYFRIFNPVLQSRKFDPHGRFIRAHCPELQKYSDKLIHWPHGVGIAEQRAAGCELGEDYPRPLVDHTVQKEKAVMLFRSVSK